MSQVHSIQQQIELPHKRNGDVDWNTLGNILTAHILGEVLCASYVDEKYGKARSDFQPATDWQFLYEEHEVVVFSKQMKNTPIKCFMGRGVINSPVEEVVKFVSDIKSRKRWDKFLVDIKEVKRLSEMDCLVYMADVATRCLVRSCRDFLYYERMSYVQDGKYVQTAMSVEHPDHPPQHGYTRGQVRPGSGWVVEPYKDSTTQTLISYLAHLDLVGLPPIITNRVMRRQPMAIHYIQEFLTQSASERHWALVATTPVTQSLHARPAGDTSRHYEEPVPILAFTSVDDKSRAQSVPVSSDQSERGGGAGKCHRTLATENGGVAPPSRARGGRRRFELKPGPHSHDLGAQTENGYVLQSGRHSAQVNATGGVGESQPAPAQHEAGDVCQQQEEEREESNSMFYLTASISDASSNPSRASSPTESPTPHLHAITDSTDAEGALDVGNTISDPADDERHSYVAKTEAVSSPSSVSDGSFHTPATDGGPLVDHTPELGHHVSSMIPEATPSPDHAHLTRASNSHSQVIHGNQE